MKKVNEMNIGELAAFVCQYLKSKGVICTLSGGACVTIYSNNQYQSGDLDFIEYISYPKKKIRDLMFEIGFTESNRYFVHPETEFFVEFPSGPLAVGSEPVKEITYLEFVTGELRIISSTDCVKDRLAAYYFWDDLQSLEQAVMVANDNKIDLKEVERWSKTQSMLEKYKIFRAKLNK